MLNKRFLLKAFGTWSRKLRPWKLRSSGSSEHWNLRGPILGVEIRGSSLFLACIHPGLVGVGLAGTHVIPNFSELKPGELQEKLRNFLKPLNVDDPVVVLGLPRSEVIVRLVSLPLLAPKSVEEALTLQVEMFKPTDTERFCWDASFLPHETQLSASLALAPQETVERLVNLFAEAGYPMTCLTVSQFSLVHLYLRGAQVKASSTDFGAKSGRLTRRTITSLRGPRGREVGRFPCFLSPRQKFARRTAGHLGTPTSAFDPAMARR